jgi:hypothetical protein
MIITSLKDVVKTLAQSLQLSTIFPAVVFVLINVGVVFPNIWPSVDWGLTNETIVTAVVSAIIILSYMLYAFNGPLIQLVEGHVGGHHSVLRFWTEAQKQKHLERFQKLTVDKARYLSRVEGKDATWRLDIYFPDESQYMLPTALGNTIAAFERYPQTRYGIDAKAMWPRLVPILQKNNYIELVAQHKAIFDFLLNMMGVMLVCGIELTYLSFYLNRLGDAFISVIVTCCLVKLLYTGAINGAMLWGLSVRVAFDLYRGELWKLLRLKPVSNYQQEVERWKEVSRLIALGNEWLDFDAFSYNQESSAHALQVQIVEKED